MAVVLLRDPMYVHVNVAHPVSVLCCSFFALPSLHILLSFRIFDLWLNELLLLRRVDSFVKLLCRSRLVHIVIGLTLAL